MKANFLQIVLWTSLIAIVQNLQAQGLNDHGLWGGIVSPTSKINPEGTSIIEGKRSLSLYSRFQDSRVGAFGLAWNYTPFENFELGGSYFQEQSYKDSVSRQDYGSVSFKYRLPQLNIWMPEIALGWQGLSNAAHPWKNLFFTSGYSISYRDVGLHFEFGGQYLPISTYDDTRVKPYEIEYQSLSSMKLTLLLSELRLLTEFVHNGDEFIQNYGFWLSPFHQPEDLYNAPFFSIGGGIRNYFDNSAAEWWGGLQFSGFSWTESQRQFISEAKDPFFFLWLSPRFTYDQGIGHSEGLRQDWLAPLYSKNIGLRASWLHHFNQSPRNKDKYYQLNSSYFSGILGEGANTNNLNLGSIEYVAGYLRSQTRGIVLRQSLTFKKWKSSFLDIGAYEMKNNGIKPYAILTQPIHPRFNSSSWQNYLEGGFYANDELGTRLLSRLAVASNIQVQAEVGYHSNLNYGLLLYWTPKMSRRIGPIEIGLSPTQRQSWRADNEFKFDNLERDRFHELFLSKSFYEGQVYENGLSFQQIDDSQWCDKFPQNDFCLKQFDNDLDGVSNELDKCLDIQEDRDGFEDGDGCPELDNDSDLIPDVLDSCPNIKEDRDGFEDVDGCPEDDNDGDGFKDIDDQCVNSAEDKDHFQDDDGCPEDDNDQDGVKDLVDVCPNHAEDFDGVMDKDGCPDYSDNDEIAVEIDICPNDDEDFDGFQDDDGCPDLDNDLDEIPDLADQCPMRREVFNSILDEDGCPD